MRPVILPILAVLAGCQTTGPGDRTADSGPQRAAEAARAAGFAAGEINAANALYQTRCAKCHRFYDPAQYARKEWDEWMTRMARKSRLNPAQEELLTRYLGASRDRAPVP